MERIDHCGNLIHFTKGKNGSLDYEDAYKNFKSIIKSEKIKGGHGMIRGMHTCVCFTESPARCLTNKGELDPSYFSRYTPFGFQMNKKEVYNLGGRPVIYSSRQEYDQEKTNQNLNWRFVTYDPNNDGKSDFTWEREWRIKINEIEINPNTVKLIFPNLTWINRFIEEHEKEYHGLDEDSECKECFCTRNATILNFSDFLNTETCETHSGSCPNKDEFPWILINMNEKEGCSIHE